MSDYYLYIDDSGKFHNKKDTHVFYSFLLLDKEKRDEFNEKFVKSFLEIRPLAKQLNPYSKTELTQWYDRLDEKNKGNIIYKKYNSAVKKKNEILIKKYEKIFELHKSALDFGVVCWCKEKYNKANKNKAINDALYYFKNKKYLILIIVKKLVESGSIKENKSLNIFIDEETDDGLSNELKAKELKFYLNYNSKSPKIFTNNLQKFIRKRKIKVQKVEYLKSQMSFPIQYTDIIANMANKIIIKKKNIEKVCKYFLKESLQINCTIYPELNTINLTKNEKCC